MKTVLALLALGSSLLACSGTTGPTSGAGGGTGGSCGSMGGSFRLTGGCGTNRCDVTQTGCSLHILCNESTDYTGAVSGATFSYSGKDSSGATHTCTGTLQGGSYSGSCSVTQSGSCTFAASPN